MLSVIIPKLIETALKVVKVVDEEKHQELMSRLEEVEQYKTSNLDKEACMTDILRESPEFISALMAIAMSDSWGHAKTELDKPRYIIQDIEGDIVLNKDGSVSLFEYALAKVISDRKGFASRVLTARIADD